MKIAVLTSRARCERFTDKAMIPAGAELVHFGPDYTEDEVIERAGDAEAIIVDAVLPVTARMIEHMPRLRLIHSEGVSYNLIDTVAASRAGVYVCNNRAVNAGQVAEHAVMLMLAVMRRLIEGDELVRSGHQIEAKTRFIMDGLHDLMGCRVGLMGFGAIGKELAKRLSPFGCELFYYKPNRAPETDEKAYGVSYLPKDELLKTCDVVALVLPANDDTRNFIDEAELSIMKPGAILINCARGLVVNTRALVDAIMSEKIYGAGLDVLEPEPVPADDPIVTMPAPYKYCVVLTPHIAGTTLSVFYNSYKNIWNNIAAVMDGREPINIVNK